MPNPKVIDRENIEKIPLFGTGSNYSLNRDWAIAARLLDEVDLLDPFALEEATMWLRAQLAAAQGEWTAAGFYYRSLGGSESEEWRSYAVRGNSIAILQGGDVAQALESGDDLPLEVTEALLHYQRGRDKRPWLGGLLGVVPGLGYAYAGEYGNGVRSLLLNSLFIWGMVETAQDDSWALFSVLTFMELTWYSGSIYGGIDASHRYNRDRLEVATEAIHGGVEPRPRISRIPLLQLEFEW